ncbi:MAG: viperin family antiviral radical SAM protein [Puniceicoccales bacterium]|jgi:radical S-adenosyl methionine domain-containing protein 2|nr:viperin family antiviral radical SAM protein [Puniceicoccales bacterium]
MNNSTHQETNLVSVATSVPGTINIHNHSDCQYRCGFCHSAFASAERHKIPQDELHEILRQIAMLPFAIGRPPRKVTFAGGEPLLSRTALEDISFARSLGLHTALVTNGILLVPAIIARLAPVLDWLAISMDSTDDATNRLIGRCSGKRVLSMSDYLKRACAVRDAGIRLKINTVVNRFNLTESFNDFITEVRPDRWKIFQCLRLVGENDSTFDKYGISSVEFQDFLTRHAASRLLTRIVPETQTDIRGTYAILAPNGCFLDNSTGIARYSQPIVKVGIEAAFAEINFSPERFRLRGGDYDPAAGLTHSL